jgi:hypothetical protein
MSILITLQNKKIMVQVLMYAYIFESKAVKEINLWDLYNTS